MTGQTSWRRLLGENYSSSYNEPTLTFNTIFFVASSSLYLTFSSSVHFTICVGHKIAKSVVFATMDSLEFQIMSLYSKLMEIVVVFFFVIYYEYCE